MTIETKIIEQKPSILLPGTLFKTPKNNFFLTVMGGDVVELRTGKRYSRTEADVALLVDKVFNHLELS